MSFEFDEEEFERDVKIKVVGVGGGGGNAVENMVRNNVEGVDFIIVNTDVAALKAKDGSAMERVQIGRKTTKGRGAGGKPPVAAESAKENSDDIEEALNGASLVFVAAGMGGGTGTGARADDFTLAFGIGDAFQFFQKSCFRVDAYEMQIHL